MRLSTNTLNALSRAEASGAAGRELRRRREDVVRTIHWEALDLLGSGEAPAVLFSMLLTAQEFSTRHLGSDPLLALSFHCLAVYFSNLGQYECAVRELRRAAFVEQRAAQRGYPELRDGAAMASLAQTRLKLSACLSNLGEHHMAMQNARAALRFLDAESHDARPSARPEAEVVPDAVAALHQLSAAQDGAGLHVDAFETSRLAAQLELGSVRLRATLAPFLQPHAAEVPALLDWTEAARYLEATEQPPAEQGLRAASEARGDAMLSVQQSVDDMTRALEKRTEGLVHAVRSMVEASNARAERTRRFQPPPGSRPGDDEVARGYRRMVEDLHEAQMRAAGKAEANILLSAPPATPSAP